ncbi:SRPBCC family protein [Modestobacter versicolor]|uniref:SRPBCC family protein n=1 Tax=Modestobacter versicolor TaxID=429133 RepID=UPI0034DEBEC3
MRDLVEEIVAAHRDVVRRGEGDGELIAVTVRRRYDAAVADVWDAVTDPERLARWFAPVSGDLREGGSFQVEGNAGGEVLECRPPSAFAVSWGGPESVVRLRLTPDGAATELALEHSVPVAFAGSGAGALYVGPGWDVGVLGLGLFLSGEAVGDPVAWEASPEVLRANAASIEAWADVVRASGTAGSDEVEGAVAAARAQFTPGLDAEGQAAEA